MTYEEPKDVAVLAFKLAKAPRPVKSGRRRVVLKDSEAQELIRPLLPNGDEAAMGESFHSIGPEDGPRIRKNGGYSYDEWMLYVPIEFHVRDWMLGALIVPGVHREVGYGGSAGRAFYPYGADKVMFYDPIYRDWYGGLYDHAGRSEPHPDIAHVDVDGGDYSGSAITPLSVRGYDWIRDNNVTTQNYVGALTGHWQAVDAGLIVPGVEPYAGPSQRALEVLVPGAHMPGWGRDRMVIRKPPYRSTGGQWEVEFDGGATRWVRDLERELDSFDLPE